jgi:hypothetical protein
MNFYDAIETLDRTGFLAIFLPFMLIFVIVFAVLQKSHILGKGDEKRKFNVILALVMGLSVVVPHALGRYPPESDPVIIINNVLPNISLVMLGVISFLLIIGVFGANIKVGGIGINAVIVIFSAIAVISTFGVAAGWFGDLPWWLSFLRDESTQILFVTILIMGIVIFFITAPAKKEGSKTSFGDFFKDMLEGSEKK